jgi:hypothetical protein
MFAFELAGTIAGVVVMSSVSGGSLRKKMYEQAVVVH